MFLRLVKLENRLLFFSRSFLHKSYKKYAWRESNYVIEMKIRMGIFFAVLISVIAIIPMARAIIIVIRPIPVYVDIKPGSWPNPVPLKSKGVLPVAVLGTADFDVTTIDPETVQLTLEGVGVSPLRWSLEDVATPYLVDLGCGGHDLEGDGYLDLTLKFKTQEVIATLGLDAFSDGDVVILILTGNLFDGTPIQGQDCIVILNG